MTDFLFRTEDITSDELLQLFVESEADRQIIDRIKGRNPIILVGSRGVGKSFLLRMAYAELKRDSESVRVLPVYLSLSKSALVGLSIEDHFQTWMMAKICAAVLRELGTKGFFLPAKSREQLFSNEMVRESISGKSRLEQLVEKLEDAWRQPASPIGTYATPDLDEFKQGLEEICTRFEIKRINVFIDEAAHALLPRQQRAFFTLFRDLRSPYLTCNAAVYPGTTSYGEVFEPTHDATFVVLNRDVLSKDYLQTMRDIVLKQADTSLISAIAQNPANFSVLAYAATGNPRILLKTVARAPKMSAQEVNEVFRSYYRNEIWSEHSSLTERYEGLKTLIDWGRNFLELTVVPDMSKRNETRLASDRGTIAFFWVHRDAPEAAKEGLRVLEYGGMIHEHSKGIKATRSEIGTRYLVNLGCLLALEKNPVSSATEVASNIDVRKMIEFGQSHVAFRELITFGVHLDESAIKEGLAQQLKKSIDVLEISDWQKTALREIHILTVSDVLTATEFRLRQAYYVGEVRSRRIRNVAIAAVLEYLAG
jgi:hypothetical protein